MAVFLKEPGQCHCYGCAVLCSAKGTTMAWVLQERWLCDLAYYGGLSFSTKKLASQIRHVLNKRVVGRVEAGVEVRGGCSTGGTRSGAALPGDARYRSARPPRSIPPAPAPPAPLPAPPSPPRAPAAREPLIPPLDHRHHGPHPTPPPTNTYYISHYILHVIRCRNFAYAL